MPTSTRVIIPLEQEWSRVGSAAVEVDEKTGMKLLAISLAAMAPKIYVPLQDIHVLEQSAPEILFLDPLAGQPEAGHA